MPEQTQTEIERMKEKEVLETKMRGFKRRGAMSLVGGVGCAFLTALALTFSHYKNPHKDKPAVLEYNAAITSLENLREERKSVKTPNIPYQPENVRRHLDKAFERSTSLDKAIGGIISNIREMDNNPEIQEYRNWRHEPTNHIGSVGVYGFFASGVFLFYNLFGFAFTEKKFLRKGFYKYHEE